MIIQGIVCVALLYCICDRCVHGEGEAEKIPSFQAVEQVVAGNACVGDEPMGGGSGTRMEQAVSRMQERRKRGSRWWNGEQKGREAGNGEKRWKKVSSTCCA